jgi:hypothetical protein
LQLNNIDAQALDDAIHSMIDLFDQSAMPPPPVTNAPSTFQPFAPIEEPGPRPDFDPAEDEVLGTETSTPIDEVFVPTEYAPDLTTPAQSVTTAAPSSAPQGYYHDQPIGPGNTPLPHDELRGHGDVDAAHALAGWDDGEQAATLTSPGSLDVAPGAEGQDPPVIAPTAPSLEMSDPLDEVGVETGAAPGESGGGSTVARMSSGIFSGTSRLVIFGAAAVVVAAAIAIPLALGGGHSAPPSSSSATKAAAPTPAAPATGTSAVASWSMGAGFCGNVPAFTDFNVTVQNPPAAGYKSVTVDFTGPGLPRSQTLALNSSGSTKGEQLCYATGPGTWTAKVVAVDGDPLTPSAQQQSTETATAG